ncbi:MAG: Mrp/NBP35 family ATP-binding protein [Odoribacteraceae bacterium]|jgi:ATP-binding protein involved in chromosome partitioning|nr:Mrp/NBP35 family ATP-binding protein [Odoribacteraceae bacterium]
MQEINEIRELLAAINYPGTSKNIVDLGMVRRVSAEGRRVALQLAFQRSNDPFALPLKRRCEEALAAAGREAAIELIFSDGRERPPSLDGVRRVIAISSGKGGVGKSTVASNLAVALVTLGYRVGLVDADIFGPSIPGMFGAADERPFMVEVDGRERVQPVERLGVKILSIGFFVEAGSATVWRGPMASNALKQMIEEGHWGDLDYLLVDLPPGTSDIHLTLVQTVALDGAIVVSTPQRVALEDAVKGINMFESPAIGVPVLGIVENMSWFTPAELPGNRYYLFGKGGAARLAAERGLPLLGEIPIVLGIMEGGEEGRPAALATTGDVPAIFLALGRRVAAAVASLPAGGKRARTGR